MRSPANSRSATHARIARAASKALRACPAASTDERVMGQAEGGEDRQDQHVAERACRVVRARSDQPHAHQHEGPDAADDRELQPRLLRAQEQLPRVGCRAMHTQQ